MEIVEIPKRETAPMTPRKAMSSLFSFPKTSPSGFSLSIPPSLHTPSKTFSETMMEENIENADPIITKWDPIDSSYLKRIPLFKENRKEAKEFIKCVKDLRLAMHFLVLKQSCSEKLVRSQNLMQIAMKRLQMEFYRILSENRENLDLESVSSRSSQTSRSSNSDEDEDIGADNAGESISEVEQISVITISDLTLISECMISCGYGKECVKIYKIFQKSILDESLYHLGIERYSSSQIKRMNSEELEHQVKNWLNAIKIAIKHFSTTRSSLSDHIFSASEKIRETCFNDISKDGAMNLFKFPELVSKSKRSPEKIFRLMDMYESISYLWPEIETIFSYESLSSIKLQALSSLQKLGDSIQTILSDFESSIQKNSLKTKVPGGGIHPLTNTVMNYLSLLANYTDVLDDIFVNSARPAPLPFSESYFDSAKNDERPTWGVSVQISWIILVLLCKLDSKAKLYNDVALSYLFLANNLQFILDKVCKTNLKYLLGQDWILKHERKVKLCAANYESNIWITVVLCLPENSSVAMSREMVKVYFRQFNSAFEEAYRKQISWIVPDGKLRDEIKLSMTKKLVPAYRAFYETHLTTLIGEISLEMLMRNAPDNLGNYLSDLFNQTDV